MKRFVRTTDGMIFDLNKKNKKPIKFESDEIISLFGLKFKIKRQSNNIEDLIVVGDLVRGTIETKYSVNKTIFNNVLFEVRNKMRLKEITEVFEFYSKIGRNYVLVAEKVNGKWRTR